MRTLISRVNTSYSRLGVPQVIVNYKWHHQRRQAGNVAVEAAGKPMEAGGDLPGVATSKLLRMTRDSALKTPGIRWFEEDDSPSPDGGRETRKMNLYQAVSTLATGAVKLLWLIALKVRDALGYVRHQLKELLSISRVRIALSKDDTSVVFGIVDARETVHV